MCTAIDFMTKDHYFGRNLDLHAGYGETVVITPRRYPFAFRRMGEMKTHHAMIGMALVARDYPLYFDATNEHGLSMAGLNVPGNAVYRPEEPGKDNVTPFELIPWVLGQCATVAEARPLLARLNLLNEPFGEGMPLSPLHFMLCDREACVVIEPVSEGLRVYENPTGVLTNNPPFPFQLFSLNNYMNVTRELPVNRFAPELPLERYCLGMGALGLPGDPSSMSRFARAVFAKQNAVCGDTEAESVSQFFHILGAVEQQRGISAAEEGEYEYTLYSSCVNTDTGAYYYKTYDSAGICCVHLHRADLDAEKLVSFSQLQAWHVHEQN